MRVSNVLPRLYWPAIFVLCAACVTPMRASNKTGSPTTPASIRFAGTEDEALTWLTSTFRSIGYNVEAQYGRHPNTVHLFQRERKEIQAEGGVYWGRKGRAPSVDFNEPLIVGSIFYVYVLPSREKETYVTFYGKPTVAGHELCGGDDSRWQLPCEDVEAPPDWSGRYELDGRAEAETLRLVIASLETTGPASSTPISTFAPPATLMPPPKEFGRGCYWDYATGSRFQHQVCQGDEKSPFDQRQEDLLKYAPTPQTRPGSMGNRHLGDTFGPN
jgi:hypothetical protein